MYKKGDLMALLRITLFILFTYLFAKGMIMKQEQIRNIMECGKEVCNEE